MRVSSAAVMTAAMAAFPDDAASSADEVARFASAVPATMDVRLPVHAVGG